MVNNIKKATPVIILLSLIWTGALVSAQDKCDLNLAAFPKFETALTQRDSGHIDSAITLMQGVIAEFEGSPGPFYVLGNWYWESGRPKDAQAMWKKARRASPG